MPRKHAIELYSQTGNCDKPPKEDAQVLPTIHPSLPSDTLELRKEAGTAGGPRLR
jgi:hypothetical protein